MYTKFTTVFSHEKPAVCRASLARRCVLVWFSPPGNVSDQNWVQSDRSGILLCLHSKEDWKYGSSQHKTIIQNTCILFLAVQNSSIGHLVCPSGTTNNKSLHNTTEWPQRLVTFETFDQRDEKTLLPTYKPTYLLTYLPNYLPTYMPIYLPP